MRPFTLHTPTELLFGAKAVPRLCRRMAVHGVGRVLLLTGRSSAHAGGAYDAVCAGLRKQGMGWEEYRGLEPNPELETVRAVGDVLQRSGVGAVLAVGGGSVIDAAKGAAASAAGVDVGEHLRTGAHVLQALPVFALVTLSGAGSEVNGDAVVTDAGSGLKTALRGPALYPRVSAVDPRLQTTAPWDVAGPGAVDVACHALEHILTGRDEETALAVACAVLRSALAAGDRVMADPGDVRARADLAWAAVLAQNGTLGPPLGEGDWTAHLLAHAVAAHRPDLAHGRILAAVVPHWLEWLRAAHSPPILDRLEREDAGPAALGERWRGWSMAPDLASLGVPEDLLGPLVESVWAHGRVGRVLPLAKKDVEAIFRLTLSPVAST